MLKLMVTRDRPVLLLPGTAPLEIIKGYQNAHKVENTEFLVSIS